MNKEERKKLILERIANAKDFKVEKIHLSNDDPIIQILNRIRNLMRW